MVVARATTSETNYFELSLVQGLRLTRVDENHDHGVFKNSFG